MGEIDVTFRHLLRGSPRPILRLAFPRRRLEPLGPLDPSVDRTRQLTADSMFRVGDGTMEAAVHVEVERAWRPGIPGRLFEYACAAVVATRLPVWSVVVLLRRGGRPPQGTGVHRVPGASGDAFVFRYHVVPLWKLDARRMRARLGLEGAPFCAAMRGADEHLVRELAHELQTTRELTKRDKRSTMQLLYVVSTVILGCDTARKIFHVESIIQDPNVQELIREWEDKGRAKGQAEGRAKGQAEGHAKGRAVGQAEGRAVGQAEGRAEEARLMLHRVLARRSLPVTPELHARIAGEADLDRLESWVDAALNATAVEDVFGDG